MTGTIPESLGSLSALTWLSLCMCITNPSIVVSIVLLHIEFFVSNFFNFFCSALSLDENQLTGTIPESLGSLSALTALHLCMCITFVVPIVLLHIVFFVSNFVTFFFSALSYR